MVLNNVKNSISIDRYYSINYVTTGTNATGQPTKYLYDEIVTFLTPTDGNKTFLGWYLNASYTGNPVIDTTGLHENLTLYAKWDSSSYETATTFITSLTNGASSSSSNIITVTSASNTCTNTFAYDLTSDNNLRYVGANPCNYVNFNCDANDNCELWRIIGVMKEVDTLPVLKIVKADDTLTRAWNSKNNNTWDGSAMQTYLNNDYLATFNANVISNYALSVQWRIGAVAYNGTVSTAYTAEKGTSSSASYIGLVNVSDYAYATSGTNDTTRGTCLSSAMNGNNITSTCYDNDYLFVKTNSSGQNQWTINKSSQGNSVIYITNVGRMTRGTSTSSYAYRPVLYLKSNVEILTSSGNGSSTSPYTLHIPS